MTTNLLPFAWMDEALCAQIGPDAWFQETGNVVIAQRVCARCPVRLHCGNHITALEAEEPAIDGRRHGVWAGMSGAARRRIETKGTGNPARDSRVVRLAERGWEAVRIADEVGCDERTVYRIIKNAKETS